MTRHQIAWAQQHDWYICLDPAQEGAIIVDDHWTVTNPETGEVTSTHRQRTFKDYYSLRTWAGY